MQYAAGATIEPDDDLADAIFLRDHPGWSWQDLQDAPAIVVEHIRAIDLAVAKRAER